MGNAFSGLYRKYTFSDSVLDLENTLDLKKICHYSSANGLLGIVQDKKEEYEKLHFWFTRSDCLNDISEGKDVKRIYDNVCKKLLEEKQIYPDFYELIKNVSFSPSSYIIDYNIEPCGNFVVDSVIDCIECQTFICSFSYNFDSLDMWRYYSKDNGGYALQFATFMFCSLDNPHKLFGAIRSFPVIYDTNEKEKMLAETIKDAYSAYISEENPGRDDLVIKFIRNMLQNYQFQFKHECYSTEKEYRFVYYRPITKPDNCLDSYPPIKYRNQNGVIIPYVDLTIEKGYSEIKKVKVSPYITNPIAVSTTKEYLEHCGFKCSVVQSQLPTRNI